MDLTEQGADSQQKLSFTETVSGVSKLFPLTEAVMCAPPPPPDAPSRDHHLRRSEMNYESGEEE